MAEEDTYFYKWNEAWLADETQFDTDYPSVPQDKGTSLAAHIIENIFGLSLDSDSSNLGGYLRGYDVRDRDAYQMVQLSLATELANEKVIECYATKDGLVKFFEIGVNESDIGGDVLYKISSGELKAKCDKVLITGYDPPPKRYVKNKKKPYDLFTFAKENLDEDTKDDTVYPRYHIYGDTLGPEACDYYREGYIEYGKLDFETRNIFSEEDEWKVEKVANKIYKIKVGFYQVGSTDVNFKNTTPRYMILDGFGLLQSRTWKNRKKYMPVMCLPEDDIVDEDVGIKLPESENKKFLGVSAVYIWGYKVNNIKLGEKDDYSSTGAVFTVDAETMLCFPYKLSEGEDYLIRRVDEDITTGYKIIFASNVSEKYKKYFGGLSVQDKIFKVSTSSMFEDQEGQTPVKESFTGNELYLRDGVTIVDKDHIYRAYLFPMNEGQSAYALPDEEGKPKGKLIVVYEWDNPCVQITDLRNEVTKENLTENVTIEFYPVVIRDETAVQVVTTGGETKTLDPKEVIPDLDEDTVEDLSETDYVKANNLENGDISLVMPFANEDDCTTIAEFIYDKQNEIANDVTYTCSPDAEPVLGELIDGNVINSIDYSYQDSSQYLISVKAGAIWQGMNSWNQSLYKMRTESIQEEGLVISVSEDNIKCNVNVRHLGVMECINISKDIIEKGDKVQVTIQNNPVSV